MPEMKISSWKFVLVEAFVLVIAIGLTYYLTSLRPSYITKNTVSSSTIPVVYNSSTTTTLTTTIDQAEDVPYLTLLDIQEIFGAKASNPTYFVNHCDPNNGTNSNYCKNIAFFSTVGNFTGYDVQFRSAGLSLNELLLVSNNSKDVYSALTKSIYPNSTTGYYPSNLIINATDSGALYSIQFANLSYTNIYVFKNNDLASVYITGANYSQDSIAYTLNEVIGKMQN